MEEKILKILRGKRLPTAKISFLLRRDYYSTVQILEDMEKKGLIKKIPIGTYIYWEAKEKT